LARFWVAVVDVPAGLKVVQDLFCTKITADVKSASFQARGWNWCASPGSDEGQSEEAVAFTPAEISKEYEIDWWKWTRRQCEFW
jgi:hypothetical protein